MIINGRPKQQSPMPEGNLITFGDNVRVRSAPETEAIGVGNLVGQVYGVTTPSVTGVAVIGHSRTDCALNVHFESRPHTLWFAPELLEFIDHAPGTEVRLNGVPKKWVRQASGEWSEFPGEAP
jgi:hypothetical protein